MYDVLLEQVSELPPSAKEPLFRRLLVEDGLSYLREKSGAIIGFEVDLTKEQTLSGFTLIAIQKHTVFAYRSDLGEPPKLVLFPPLDKLFDPAFELLDLYVAKKRFTDSKFVGTKITSGTLQDLVKDLTPPQKQVDLPDMTVAAMTKHMEEIQQGREKVEVPKAPDPVPEAPETLTEPYEEDPGFAQDFDEGDAYEGFEENTYEGFDEGYDDYSGYDTYEEPESEPEPEPEPEPEMDERSRKLKVKAPDFAQLSEVSDFCAGTLGVSRPLAVTVVNKALQSDVAPQYRIDLAVKLFCKLFDEKRI